MSRGGDQDLVSNRVSVSEKSTKGDHESNLTTINQPTTAGSTIGVPTATSLSNPTLSTIKTESIKSSRTHQNLDFQQPSSISNCSICHIPYPESSVPFHSSLLNCRICKKAKVSDVLFMTIEPPCNIPIVGRGCLIQARVCRNKRDSKGEQCAKELSDVIKQRTINFLKYCSI